MLTSLCLVVSFVATSTYAQKGKPKVIELDEIVIEGEVQKPNAFYILNRSNLGYEVLDLRTSFIKKILKSVEKDLF